MAPIGQPDNDAVEGQLKDIIQDLYQLMVQVNSYDLAGRSSKEVLEHSVKRLDQSLLKIHNTATHPNAKFPEIPPELIQYVDNGRNPEIYTREFVELARRGNQLMKGKKEAFGSFRDTLASEMSKAMPEIRDDIEKVVVETGGDKMVVVRAEE